MEILGAGFKQADSCCGVFGKARRQNAASCAAQEGAEATKNMTGRAGRSGYVNTSILQGTPDPGAHAVSVWMQELAAQLSTEAL